MEPVTCYADEAQDEGNAFQNDAPSESQRISILEEYQDLKNPKQGVPENRNLTERDAKEIRAEIQYIVDLLQFLVGGSRERSLVVTKLEEAKMWLGKELGNIGGEDLNAKRDRKELTK